MMLLLLPGCTSSSKEKEVVIYTSVDQQYSEPVFKKFEQKTGIRVLPVYEAEAAKTTGLDNRLIAEKGRPQADVFWNSEFMQTMLLKEKGVLAPYKPTSAQGIPDSFRDPEGYWTGFGGRARVLLVNTNLVKTADYPRSIFDLAKADSDSHQVGIAHPLFGTSATHAAALYAVLGRDEGKKFYEKMVTKGVQVVESNSAVRDLVARGRLKFGLTDTDEAYQALREGAPVRVVVPDQDGVGVFIIPNTVALVAGAPHPGEAKAMIDHLLSAEVERELTASGFIQASLRSTGVDDGVADWSKVKKMQVNLENVYHNLGNVNQELTQIFVK